MRNPWLEGAASYEITLIAGGVLRFPADIVQRENCSCAGRAGELSAGEGRAWLRELGWAEMFSACWRLRGVGRAQRLPLAITWWWGEISRLLEPRIFQ